MNADVPFLRISGTLNPAQWLYGNKLVTRMKFIHPRRNLIERERERENEENFVTRREPDEIFSNIRISPGMGNKKGEIRKWGRRNDTTGRKRGQRGDGNKERDNGAESAKDLAIRYTRNKLESHPRKITAREKEFFREIFANVLINFPAFTFRGSAKLRRCVHRLL